MREEGLNPKNLEGFSYISGKEYQNERQDHHVLGDVVENLHFQTLPSIFRTALTIAEVHTLSPALSHCQKCKVQIFHHVPHPEGAQDQG